MFERPAHGKGRYPIGCRAFSLVEVVLAMGIISIGAIVVAGLMPLGLNSNRNSVEESQAVNLLQALVADRQSANYSSNSPLYNLPALTAVTNQVSGLLFVMEDGVTTNVVADGARYRVAYTVYPASTLYADATNYASTGPYRPVFINLQVSWPAPQTNFPASVETVATFMQ